MILRLFFRIFCTTRAYVICTVIRTNRLIVVVAAGVKLYHLYNICESCCYPCNELFEGISWCLCLHLNLNHVSGDIFGRNEVSNDVDDIKYIVLIVFCRYLCLIVRFLCVDSTRIKV